MQEKNSYRPEELLYRMGHSTRAMNAFFSMDEEAREAALGRLPLSRTLHRQKRRWKRKWHGWKQSVRIMTGVLDNNRRRPF